MTFSYPSPKCLLEIVRDVLGGFDGVTLRSITIPAIDEVCLYRSSFVSHNFFYAVLILLLFSRRPFRRVDVRIHPRVGLDVQVRSFLFGHSGYRIDRYGISNAILVEYGVIGCNANDSIKLFAAEQEL